MPDELPVYLAYLVAWATVGRAMLVYVDKLPPTCRACGRRLERRHLGENVCTCSK